VVTDLGTSPFFKPSQEVVATANRSGLYACWSEPIISSDGGLLGTIANYSDHKGEPTADNIRVLEWSAWIAAIAIERKKMEKALRESEEKFSIAFHSSPVMIAISTVKSRVFVEANNSYLRAIGYTREEIIGHSVDTVALTWINQDEYRRMINQMRQQHKFTDEEFTFKMKSGEIKQWLCSGEAIEIGGEPCFINVATDITERKLAEEKLKSVMTDLEQSSAQLIATNKELESFSYSVSHDLRSPLRSIDGFSQALLEDYTAKLDEKGQDYLTRIRHASQRMGDLIDGVLKLSRLTRSEMRHEKVDLSGIATEISTRLKETNPDRNVEFAIDNGLSADGDPQMLRIVLENLLGNAMKFTQKTELARIKFGSSPNGAQKMFYIKDNGAGFDMQFKDKLFGAFQRLHDTADFPGTGIGLATVQRIINRHGGSVRAEAEPGKGATFYFSLNKEG
jgi:PAS domain S-box-containing protein